MKWFCLAAVAIAFPQAAHAGTLNAYRPIGFGSGGVFAFEVFGDFDAIEGAHSTYYFVDLNRDGWVPGTPIEESSSEGDGLAVTADLKAVRVIAERRAEPLLDRYGPFDYGHASASQAFGQNRASWHELEWHLPIVGALPAVDDIAHALKLTTFPAAAASDCPESTSGISLTLDGTVIYQDAEIPGSRGCPVDYMLQEVRSPYYGEPRVAVIAVFTPGFEGWDTNYIAIPLPTLTRQ